MLGMLALTNILAVKVKIPLLRKVGLSTMMVKTLMKSVSNGPLVTVVKVHTPKEGIERNHDQFSDP